MPREEVRNPENSVLVCRTGQCLWAIPLAHISETMRPLPVEPLASMPSFILGAARMRGVAVPVVNMAAVLGLENGSKLGRFVSVTVENRQVALAVEAVEGVRAITPESLAELPP